MQDRVDWLVRWRSGAGRRLCGWYVQLLIWYLAGLTILWLIGVESIYGHITPFYARFEPVFGSFFIPGVLAGSWGSLWWIMSRAALGRKSARQYGGLLGATVFFLWLLLVLYRESQLTGTAYQDLIRAYGRQLLHPLLATAIFMIGLGGIHRYWSAPNAYAAPPSRVRIAGLLCGVMLMAILFSLSVAMIRGGIDGITQPYSRTAYECVGDIEQVTGLKSFLSRYVELQPTLSIHGRVHPPGPTLLFWGASLFIGSSPLALSLFSLLFGTLAIPFLFLWVREWETTETAMISCFLYALTPAIVLFSVSSADLLFIPFSLATLFSFERALRRGAIGWGMATGLGFALMAVLKFSLLALGSYFLLVGCFALYQGTSWKRVLGLWGSIALVFCAFQTFLWWWSGYSYLASFETALQLLMRDRQEEALIAPRYSFWWWRILNPLAWFYYAGIPVSLLFVWRLFRPLAERRRPAWVLGLVIVLLALSYPGKGEGERSMLFLFPLLAAPAAQQLQRLGKLIESDIPLLCTLAFLAFQCWLTESYFYTYW